MLGEIAKGNDPRTGRRINTLSDITLREVLQKFLETKPIREATKNNYVSAINCHFQEWLDKPITSITKDMVEQRHSELTVAPNFHNARFAPNVFTMGEKLEVPPYVLKKLVNHSVNDITERYLVLDIERLRVHMSLITSGFLKLLDVSGGEMIACNPAGENDITEATQLRSPFEGKLLPV